MEAVQPVTDTCEVCKLPPSQCQDGLYERVAAASHHVHFNRNGTCTLFPSCKPEFRSRAPNDGAGHAQAIVGSPPEGWEAVTLGRHSREAQSLVDHYGAPGLHVTKREVVWWVKPAAKLAERRAAEQKAAKDAMKPDSSVRWGELPEDARSRSEGRCRDCSQPVIWTRTASGQKIPVDPDTLRPGPKKGILIGKDHGPSCPSPREKRARRTKKDRDEARQGG